MSAGTSAGVTGSGVAPRIQDAEGVRVNGIVTPYADAELYAHLLPLPLKERARALKQLALVGLLVTRGRLPVDLAATGVMPVVPVSVPVQKEELAAAGALTTGGVPRADAIEAVPGGAEYVPAPVAVAVAEPGQALPSSQAEPVPGGGGSYDLADVDLADVDLAF